MHGVRRSLLQKQASALQLPLHEVPIPKGATNVVYEQVMEATMSQLKTELQVSSIVFGDLFLQDIREYREKLLSRFGMQGLFPLWGKDTGELAKAFIKAGFRAIICTVDPKKLDPRFCGCEFDPAFLAAIPASVDPCGENGEFHTFVFDGPIFQKAIPIAKGPVVLRDGFYFADILPLEEGQGGGEGPLFSE
jgi:uncharacterized protein (TIGR00290 family)